MKVIPYAKADRKSATFVILLCLVWMFAPVCLAEAGKGPLVIRYPTLSESYGQSFDAYFLEFLNLALDKSGQDYRLETVVFPEFREARSEMSLLKGLYDVHWLHTNQQREERLLPIRIPLYKGLIGWRLLLVREDEQRFSKHTELADLQKLKTVQGHDWPDTDILAHNGLSVTRSASWEGMFKMLAAGRVDYLPRSVIEVWRELEQFPEQALAIEKDLALVYPTAYYFFVSRDNTPLAEAIEKGLNLAIEDGSFDEIFMRYFGKEIKRAAFHKRTIIRLENPLLPSDTPPEHSKLWFDPLREHSEQGDR